LHALSTSTSRLRFRGERFRRTAPSEAHQDVTPETVAQSRTSGTWNIAVFDWPWPAEEIIEDLETGRSSTIVRRGVVTSEGSGWCFLDRGDGRVSIWPTMDGEISSRAIVRAAKTVREKTGPDARVVVMRLVPPPESVIGGLASPDSLMATLDDALIGALAALGVDKDFARKHCIYGMGSEYRGWMAFVREQAMPIFAERGVQSALAEELVMLTSAIAVSMRHGNSTMEHTIATALHSLANYLPDGYRPQYR
jgi:hypothetical protein